MTDALSDLLASGGDERIFLDPDTGANKYHLNPLDFEGLLQRGSCTCNPLTPDGFKSASAFLRNRPGMRYRKLMADQGRRLRELFQGNKHDEFHTVFCPSGSDAMYLPLLFQRLMNPEQTIINIVSCREELGSGSILAARARYYAAWNQLGEAVPIGEAIEGAGRVETHFLPARDEDGFIPDRRQAIRDRVAEAGNRPVIGNLVFGSKSGIKDDLDIIDEFPVEVMWVVDMCQFRVDPALIHRLLMKGVMIMVTGSKFYQAPPFCGALLVPKTWVERIAAHDGQPAAAYARLFTRWDFPPSMGSIRDALPDFRNWGLRLRWAIALDEMEAYNRIPKIQADAWIRRWNRVVIGHLALSETFGLMPDMELTNDSIISFTVRVKGRALSKSELKSLFDHLVTSKHPGLGTCDRFFMGQPVDYGDRAFVRLAIGSYTVRRELEAKKFDFAPDLQVVDLINHHARSRFS